MLIFATSSLSFILFNIIRGLAHEAHLDELALKQETEKLKVALEKEILKIEVNRPFTVFLDDRWSQFD